MRRAVAFLFDKHRVLPALAWAVVIRDGANLIGRSRVPHLVIVRVVTPENSDMAVDSRLGFQEDDIALLRHAAVQKLVNRIELVNA